MSAKRRLFHFPSYAIKTNPTTNRWTAIDSLQLHAGSCRFLYFVLFAVSYKVKRSRLRRNLDKCYGSLAAKNELAPLRGTRTAFFAVASVALICYQISSMPLPCLTLFGTQKGMWQPHRKMPLPCLTLSAVQKGYALRVGKSLSVVDFSLAQITKQAD